MALPLIDGLGSSATTERRENLMAADRRTSVPRYPDDPATLEEAATELTESRTPAVAAWRQRVGVGDRLGTWVAVTWVAGVPLATLAAWLVWPGGWRGALVGPFAVIALSWPLARYANRGSRADRRYLAGLSDADRLQELQERHRYRLAEITIDRLRRAAELDAEAARSEQASIAPKTTASAPRRDGRRVTPPRAVRELPTLREVGIKLPHGGIACPRCNGTQFARGRKVGRKGTAIVTGIILAPVIGLAVAGVSTKPVVRCVTCGAAYRQS